MSPTTRCVAAGQMFPGCRRGDGGGTITDMGTGVLGGTVVSSVALKAASGLPPPTGDADHVAMGTYQPDD